MSNPLLTVWSTPHETPPFAEIKPEHFLPAFEQAQQWLKEYRVPVVVEVILERVTNIAMGTEINNITEFEDLVGDVAADAPTAIALDWELETES